MLYPPSQPFIEHDLPLWGEDEEEEELYEKPPPQSTHWTLP